MKRITEEGSHPIKAWLGMKEVPKYSFEENYPGETTQVLDLEAAALTQLKNIARLPFILGQGIAVMPDAHLGKGAIIPAAVGIGCGMNAVRLSIKGYQLPDSLKEVRDAIEAAVPLGKAGHDHQKLLPGMNQVQRDAIEGPLFGGSREKFCEKAGKQLGSLGSGNHFIEICTDENDDVWVVHTLKAHLCVKGN